MEREDKGVTKEEYKTEAEEKEKDDDKNDEEARDETVWEKLSYRHTSWKTQHS